MSPLIASFITSAAWWWRQLAETQRGKGAAGESATVNVIKRTRSGQ